MDRLSRASLVAVIALLSSCASPHGGPDPVPVSRCQAYTPEINRHELHIRLDEDGSPTEIEKGGQIADSYCVNPRDTVEWRVKGADGANKRFFIIFDDKTPFRKELLRSTEGVATARVRFFAPKNEELKYWVVVEGGVLDPIIIIRTAK